MKKLVGLFVALFVCSIFTVKGWTTDPTPFECDQKSAVAAITATGMIEFSANLYKWNIDDKYNVKKSTGVISWTTDLVKLGKDDVQWLPSDAYCLIKSTITTTGKVYIYQNNKANTGGYAANNNSWNYYAGLVKKDSNGGDGNILGLKFYSCPISSATKNLSSVQPNFGDKGINFCDISDKEKIPTFESDTTLATSKGIKDETINGFSKGDHVLFFGANFLNVASGEEYGTTTINFAITVE